MIFVTLKILQNIGIKSKKKKSYGKLKEFNIYK